MMSLSGILDQVENAFDGLISQPLPVTIGTAAAGAALGATAVGLVGVVSKKRKSTKKKKSTKRKTTRRKKSKGRRTPRTAGKGKDRSTKRIRYTKNGQPYVLTRSGKAKFIKRSSAKQSHRRKGGRY